MNEENEDADSGTNNETLATRPMIRILPPSAASALFIYWFLEICAFTLLPLVVYLIIFFALGIELDELIKLPEWMFITIVVYGGLTRKLIVYYREYQGFNLKAIRTLSLGVLGIVTSAVFLALSTTAQLNSSITLSDAFYTIQIALFVLSG